MANYIKSHSNYVLQSRHQKINDGTIWSRDITTIGAINQFAPGQTPIYRSGNFIITARDGKKVTKHYNVGNWQKNPDGEVWTLETIQDMVSDYKTESDVKIVLKRDYYDFRDFAYYGSLTELFRASITDIINRFPGEMYFSLDKVYYTTNSVIDGEIVTVPHELGEDGFVYEVKNPFGIDIYSSRRPLGADVLKYFAEQGYLNYELYDACETDTQPFEIKSIVVCDDCKKPGDRIDGCCGCESIEGITFNENCNCDSIISINVVPANTRGRAAQNIKSERASASNIEIRLYKGNDGKIHYLYKDTNLAGYHLRPKRSFLDAFYEESNAFERLILDIDTAPRYSSTFSVIRENEFGYYRELKDFTFPTSEGGYNPTIDDNFINELVEIGEFYDERFTDNLYRSMTHEAIKNFDWTYTREYEDGDEIEFVAGGKKIQKALRIFAREFDEIKAYIDNIRYMNRVTYDQRSNLPDYFLSDVCEQDGWDIKNVAPYDVKFYDDSGEKQIGNDCGSSSASEALFNNTYRHEYTQNAKDVVKPYTKDNIKDGSENGYFYDCTDGGGFSCWLNDVYGNKIRKAVSSTTSSPDDPMNGCNVYYEDISVLKRDDNTSRITNRIKSYTDETEYTYMSVNNEFLRRLYLNSKYIWRHKGTIEGMEMVLGMFGLKSKRWLDKMNSNNVERRGNELWYQTSLRYPKANDECNVGQCEVAPDYEIKEYTSFAKRIEEEWDVEHQMYRIDWVNTTKTIVYDNRSTSNYTKSGSVGRTIMPYQGILVGFRDEYEGYGDDRYLKIPGTDDFYLDERGDKVPKRYLYPNFNKYEQNDGNPYFQMDGGWLSKKLTGGESEYNFQFDVDDNIVHNKYVYSGKVTDNGFIDDNHPLYKETVRSIKRVENLNELISIPQIDLHNGMICYVGKVGADIAVINGQIFDITHQGTNLRYVTYIRKNGFIAIGDMYFDGNIVVYDRDGNEISYYINDKEDGYEVKAYIKEGDDFISYSLENPAYTISSFMTISDEVEEESDSDYTNYFVLDDVSFSDSIAVPGTREGWRRLKTNDHEYMRINTIYNYYEGNNGHNGNMVYDSGHEYLTYFNRIFKYAYDNDMFDERCYTDGFDWLGGEVFDYGFSGLVESNEMIKQYDRFLLEDEKIHYFGNLKTCPDPDCQEMTKPAYKRNYDVKNTSIYGDWHKYAESESDFKKKIKDSMWIDTEVSSYTLVNEDSTYSPDNLSKIGITTDGIDDVTNQIVNNKRLKIIFNMKYCFNTKEGQNELKYIDNVVLGYLTQVVPSTAIFDVEYKYCNFNYEGC